jgi:hypothetical protein
MADFPGRPRIIRGALVVFGTSAPVPTQLIVFPLNPDSVSRRFDLGAAAAGRAAAGTAENHTPATAPAETFTVTLELDATDDLEQPDQHPITTISGLLPVLSALEQLLYPSVLMARLVKTLAAIGGSTITPATRPWVVFVWGPGRIVPVKVAGLTITEQAFDPRLNPISARAELQLTVLSAEDLAGAPAMLQGLPAIHAVTREALSATETAASLSAAPTVLPL